MVQFNVPQCFSNDCDCAGTPPTGVSPACIPSECTGPQCCCCASSDVVSSIRARCYDRVFFSCNKDGTSPGPGEDPFPAECTQCFDACDRAMGGAVACTSISQYVGDPTWQPSPADWYNFPPGIGPCDCDCAEFVDPSNPAAGCNLTCVKCSRCNADVEVTSSDCSYQFNLTPSTGCCGSPAFVDVVFAIDYSRSMRNVIEGVKTSAGDFVDKAILTGAQVRFGLLVYGKDNSCIIQPSDIISFANGDILTTSVDEFKAALEIDLSGGSEPDFAAAAIALQTYPWKGVENILFVIGDELIDLDCGPPVGDLSDISNAAQQPSAAVLSDLANTLGVRVFTVQPPSGNPQHDSRKADFSINTNGGQDLDINIDFSILLDDLDFNAFGSSCDCLDNTPRPVEWCKGGVSPQGECIDPDVNVPIGVCVEDDNSDCGICNEPMTFEVCGEIVVVEPDPNTINLVCCGELTGGGCTCPTEKFPSEGCCGFACSGIEDICKEFQTLQDAIDSVWCECWQKANEGEFILETSKCVRCTIPDADDPNYGDFDIGALENCEIKVPNGAGGYTRISRSQIVTEVTAAWAACETPEELPPPSISEASCLPECDRQDECVVGSPVPVCGGNEDIRDCRKAACSNAHVGCTSVRNPDTVILNNGIGLVAYESMENVSVIKIEQFNTSVPAKILPNHRTNYGRLQHSLRWENKAGGTNFKLVKLYYYEDLPTNFINGVLGIPAEGSLTDLIVFQSGPFENQCFSLDDPEPFGEDDIGNFIRFTVPNTNALSHEYLSIDDVYNVEWFIIDSDDTGMTGSVSGSEVPGSEFLLNRDSGGVNAINVVLELSPHIHNGKPVPAAYPSIAAAHNYMNAVENSHYVYLTYQALEDQKWNLYMRQLRLSEYSRKEVTTSGNTVNLQSLGITELVYRAICVTDKCEDFGDDFLAKRSVAFEVILQDGREVFNQALLTSTESWTICPGEPAGSFLKKKVVMDFTHSIVINRCPNQFEFNEMFYNWEVGDEFSIPFTELTSSDLFILLKRPNDSVIPLGITDVQISGITATSSQVSAIWYEDNMTNWSTPDNSALQNMLRYKGLDVSEPIPITEFEEGHCTHPVVSVNTNNEVFVIYECTDPQVHQIHITGTAAPSTSFPLGIFNPKNLDANLDYFLSSNDFRYRNTITLPGDGINQLPDMHIDVNDVIHVAWQSNRDDYWEIYYSNSEEQFRPKRITDFKSKSLKPSITGDTRGNLHIAWHDNRFDSWEIMMAYRDDERVLTLREQDPYLAGVRNTGYSHSTDIIPLVMQNANNTSLCVSNLFVRFFTDRLLTKASFDVLQSEFPMAFQIPGIIGDRVSASVGPDEIVSDWVGQSVLFVITINLEGTDVDMYSGVIDTVLAGSSYDTVTLTAHPSATWMGEVRPSYIRFAAGETPEMDAELQSLKQEAVANGEDPNLLTNFDTSWRTTSYISADNMSRGVAANVDNLILNDNTNIPLDGEPVISSTPKGRYKKMFITVPKGSAFILIVNAIDVVSVIKGRLCIAPGETLTGFLDVTPFIRVDSEGNEVVETPVPVGINKNQTYFIAVIAIQDNGQIFVFDDQKKSISCESCVNSTSPWNSSSCTYPVDLLNDFSEQETKFINARIRFYTDQTQINLVAQFNAFYDGDLESFTTDDNQQAQDIWTEAGLEVFYGKTRSITLWPTLSNTTGLLCGVTYWVSTEICVGSSENSCGSENLQQTKLENWICNCGSPRWEEKFGDAPTNIRDVIRWISSGDGFSDTRLTETGVSVNNYNPIIRLRTDLTGIVIYESNRDDLRLVAENKQHTLYGTAFSVFPDSKMYASGAEAIDSAFGEILIQSDIPITACDGSNCNDSGAAMQGRNANFVLDQYDNIFLAAEQLVSQIECAELQKDSQRNIVVHRCGIQSKNLVFTPKELEGSGNFPCDANEILGKTAPLITDRTFKKLIRLVRVNNKYAKYHITRSKKPSAVVDQCNIELDIITESDTIAVRLKNENDAWSTWLPFDPELGENTVRMPWALSAGSGVKTVTIAAATYQGLSTSFSISIVADYKGVDHTIKFYKSQSSPFPNPAGVPYDALLNVLNDNAAAFAAENLLQNLGGIPVAGIRQPIMVEDELVQKTGEFIFIEIIPTQKYLEDLGILGLEDSAQQNLLPTFDVLQQGAQDLFGVPTIFDETKKVFKGVFPVQKEDETFYKDGLSFVIPHFQQDCGDLSISLLPTGEYIRDQFNLVVPGTRTADENVVDAWANERDELGNIKHQIDIRGTEDPYFIFGDPNYRLKQQNE